MFWQLARACPQAVLDSNIQWNNAQQLDDLRALGGRLVEVRCECPPQVAVERYAARAAIGHAAQRHTTLDADRLRAYGQPVGIGPLITVDTTAPVDVAAVAASVRAALQA